jgi:hypothetical protein
MPKMSLIVILIFFSSVVCTKRCQLRGSCNGVFLLGCDCGFLLGCHGCSFLLGCDGFHGHWNLEGQFSEGVKRNGGAWKLTSIATTLSLEQVACTYLGNLG